MAGVFLPPLAANHPYPYGPGTFLGMAQGLGKSLVLAKQFKTAWYGPGTVARSKELNSLLGRSTPQAAVEGLAVEVGHGWLPIMALTMTIKIKEPTAFPTLMYYVTWARSRAQSGQELGEKYLVGHWALRAAVNTTPAAIYRRPFFNLNSQ